MEDARLGQRIIVTALPEILARRFVPAYCNELSGEIVDIAEYDNGEKAYRIRFFDERHSMGFAFWMPRQYFQVVKSNIQEECLRRARVTQ